MIAPEEPEPAPSRMHVVGAVWGGAGVIALVVAVVASSLVIAVFGALAVVAGALLYLGQSARMRSARETRRTLRTTVSRPLRDDASDEPLRAGEPPRDDGPTPDEPAAADGRPDVSRITAADLTADDAPPPAAAVPTDTERDAGPDAPTSEDAGDTRPPADHDENG